ncbi:MAG: Flp pilus assembly complex ATPase component TadA [Oscillospiraceae bacterium]|nr:Flp pilus assembly complex ATPase component TadA [Oscillospiraceae bacterium]
MAPPVKNLPLGEILVQNGFISESQLQDALVKQTQSGGKMLGDVMLEMGLVSETQLAQALSMRLKVPFVDLSSIKVDTAAVGKIPENIAKEKLVFAFAINHNRLMVATNDPVNFYIFEDLKVQTGMEVVPQISTKTMIEAAINKFYSSQAIDSTMSELEDEAGKTGDLAQDLAQAESEGRIDNAPIVKLVNMMVETAFRMGCTDIHIEAFKDRTRIRFRIDGELVEQDMKIPPSFHNSIITRIKILGGMNIAERRIPLDGRFGTRIDGINLDMRVSTIPCVYGEKCVIRLLSTADAKAKKITELGMTEYNYEMFKQIIRCPNGVMLVTGPTGSGKSTTLYATLGELSQPNVNIVTVEDPVEKKIDGINQCQINDKAGMTFAAALRSILRQDPDIIMVGEIRDGETADIAIRAAITGHFVLSTLHTNDAASTIVRLVDMGVAPYMVATSVVGIIAQRLVKLLCNSCKETFTLEDPDELKLMGKTTPTQICRPHPGGCKVCHGAAYSGRTAIHEIIVTTPDIKELISSGATAEEIGAQATKNGTRLLRDNVSQMVLAGKTSMDELVKATYTV